MKKKPNCKDGNVACGQKCQPRSYKCPSEKGTETNLAADKFVSLVAATEVAEDYVGETNLDGVIQKFEENGLKLLEEFSPEGVAQKMAELQNINNKARSRDVIMVTSDAMNTYRRLFSKEKIEGKSEEELKELLEFANKKIYATSSFSDLSEDDKKKYSRAFIFAKNGDSLKKVKAVGDKSLRGQASIPPIPEKFEGGGEPVDESFRNFLEEAKVMLQVNLRPLKAILESGRIKNTFDDDAIDFVGSDAPDYYRQTRRNTEERKFGIRQEGLANERPIYAYLESPQYLKSAPELNEAEMFGEARIVIKDEVKKRATVTIGDSLYTEDNQPTPLLAPTTSCYGQEIKSITHEGGAVADTIVNNAELGKTYLETQIFGGVSLSDIEFVFLPAFAFERYPELYDMLIAAGIAFEIKK